MPANSNPDKAKDPGPQRPAAYKKPRGFPRGSTGTVYHGWDVKYNEILCNLHSFHRLVMNLQHPAQGEIVVRGDPFPPLA